MTRETRHVEVMAEAELTVFEMTEDEVLELKEMAKKILRICGLVPQDFDRKAVMDVATGMIEMLSPLGKSSR